MHQAQDLEINLDRRATSLVLLHEFMIDQGKGRKDHEPSQATCCYDERKSILSIDKRDQGVKIFLIVDRWGATVDVRAGPSTDRLTGERPF